MTEIWIDVVGYEGLYQVSNFARVKSVKKNLILSQNKNNTGYYMVQLTKDRTGKPKTVHRLVAAAFKENPMNLPCVNHLDENKENNLPENLEWCTQRQNMNHNDCSRKIGKRNAKPVMQFDKNMKLIKIFPSALEAQRQTGISNGDISDCVRAKRMTAGGYIWMR